MGRVDSMPLTLSTYPSLDPLVLEPAPGPTGLADLRSAGQWISRQWKETTREVLRDLRSKESWKPIFIFLYLCWVGFLLLAIGMLASTPNITSLLQGFITTACQPDGNFSPYANSYNAWDWASSGFFEITLAFGPISFTAAKVIDIIWDVIIGRLGQVAITMVSWHVFSQYTTTSMDDSPVTYRTFWIIFLHKEASFLSITHLIKDFFSHRRLNSMVAMIFMIATVAFTLGFPMLSSAMTGYTPITKAFVQNEDGNLIPFSDFHILAYVIHDGYRINLTTNAYVTRPLGQYYIDPIVWKGDDGMAYYGCYEREACDVVNAASKYVSTYGFYGNNNTNSIWEGARLPAPALNISAYYIPPGSLFGNNWIDPNTQRKPFQDQTGLTYTESNRTYSLDYIMTYGSCQPVLNEYQWGFSFAQVFILSVLLFIWTVGISIMWLRVRSKLPHQGHPEVPKGWKAVILLAEAMNMELPQAHIDVHTLKDQEVKEKIHDRLGGGSVRFDAPLRRKEYSFRADLYMWFMTNDLGKRTWRNKWWWAVLLIAIAPFPPVMMLGEYVLPPGVFLITMSSCTILGVLFALSLGSTIRSRLFVTWTWIMVGLVVFISVCASGVLTKYER
ncbi:hypothetical protein F5Y13DRAFT_161016 [Hypoxylon sp. FL1857]|nr:hypothetical protein F5Y13DRAFT_161016 [Hypoxylon sp. FL1857]